MLLREIKVKEGEGKRQTAINQHQVILKPKPLRFGLGMAKGKLFSPWKSDTLYDPAMASTGITDKFSEEFAMKMFGTNSPWLCPEFPLVEPGENHVVLFEVPNGSNAPYKPKIGEDKWDSDHVKLPCSDQNLCNIHDVVPRSENELDDTPAFIIYLKGIKNRFSNVFGRIFRNKRKDKEHTIKRWDLIVKALTKPMRNTQDILEAVLTYQTDYKKYWEFDTLSMFFEEHLEKSESKKFFKNVLPEIAKLALALPDLIKSPIPLLKKGQNMSISLTQMQVACLLANAFFCTFPERSSKRNQGYPVVNFDALYNSFGSVVLEKLKCICHYFTRICKDKPNGVMTFSRRYVSLGECPDWAGCSSPMSELPLVVDADGFIEDANGCIQVDFANEFIGGAVLYRGAVQEEIRFICNTELIVSLLFTEVMGPSEAVMIIGSECYNAHTGYHTTFKWAGDYKDVTPRDSSNRRRCAVLALDAVWFPNPEKQYSKEMIDRELNKAYAGFSFYSKQNNMNYPGIATGKWGCGAFGGNPYLKSLIQLMCCAAIGRPLAFYTFQDSELRDYILDIYNIFVEYNVTVGDLYKLILEFCTSDVEKANPYLFLEEKIKKK